LHERLSAIQILGMVVILAGVMLVTFRPRAWFSRSA
jgi:drug/metabolite transporter (DMT)-like permease